MALTPQELEAARKLRESGDPFATSFRTTKDLALNTRSFAGAPTTAASHASTPIKYDAQGVQYAVRGGDPGGGRATAPAAAPVAGGTTAGQTGGDTAAGATGGTVKPFQTFEQKATTGGQEIGLLGEGEKVLTLEEQVPGFLEDQKTQKTRLERQIAEAQAAEKFQKETAQREGAAAISATEASFAQSREGAQATARAGIAPFFADVTAKRLGELQNRINAAEAARVDAMADLDKAQKEGRAAAAKAIQTRLDQIATEKANAEKEKIQAETQAKLVASDLSSKANVATLDMFDTLGSAVASFTTDQLSSLISKNNAAGGSLDLGVALMYQQKAKLTQSAELAKTEQERAKFLLEAANIESQIRDRETVKPTADQQDFGFYQELLKSDPALAEKFARAKGFSEKPDAGRFKTFNVGDDVYSINETTGKTEKVAGANSRGGIAPTGKLASATFAGRSITLDSGALAAFSMANDAAIAAGLGGIQTGAVHTSSFRSDDAQRALYGKGRSVDALLSADFSPEEAKAYSRPGESQVTWTMDSRHKSGMAIDIFPDHNYIAKVKPFLEAQGWVQTLPGQDAGHFEFKGRAGTSATSEAAQNAALIMSGSADMSDFSAKHRAAIATELGKLREAAARSGDIQGIMRASAGGKNPDVAFRQSFTKGLNVIGQLSSLKDAMTRGGVQSDANGTWDLSPIAGWLREANPWDANAQQVNAILQAAVPNLARGIYGEVGVLTDNDVAMYRKTLPNLRSTDQVKQLVLAATLRSVRNSLENQITTYARTGVDMSGLVPTYDKIDNEIKAIEAGIGIKEPTKNSPPPSAFQSAFSVLSEDQQVNFLLDETTGAAAQFDYN